MTSDARRQTLASFDFQWGNLPAGDFMPGDPWFDKQAPQVLAEELCAVRPAWFAGKRVLDAGCGRGRWTRVFLELGARVTAVDFSEAGLARTRELAGPTDRLTTRQVDLLDLPDELAAERFDFVFSFGVLHHTGDTWAALENVSRLVAPDGGMFLYLYGATSWDPAQEAEIERLRTTLAQLPFDRKIDELKRRFPGEDPHQLFDLLSPTINERVFFDDVKARLQALGFPRVDRTIADTEVYLRATRSGFPESALLPPVESRGAYLRELRERFDVRKGAGAEIRLRSALRGVAPRVQSPQMREALRHIPDGADVLDASFAPERLGAADITTANLRSSAELSPLQDEFRSLAQADAVVFAGASLGAGRFPSRSLERLAEVTRPGGHVIVELAEGGLGTRRALWERVADRGRSVPEKLASLLARHRRWSTGDALYALGGEALLNPIGRAEVERAAGNASLEILSWSPAREGTAVIVTRRV